VGIPADDPQSTVGLLYALRFVTVVDLRVGCLDEAGTEVATNDSTRRMDSMTGRKRSIFAVLFATVMVAGCATQGDMDQIGSRLDAIDERLDRMEQATAAAEERAVAAEEMAEQAVSSANAAAMSAKDAARTSEAIFDKSVRK
jgi:outer membrane murein-binding lipoprotein Lpp